MTLVPAVRAHTNYNRRWDMELTVADGDRLAVGDGSHGIAGAGAWTLDHAAIGEAVVVEG